MHTSLDIYIYSQVKALNGLGFRDIMHDVKWHTKDIKIQTHKDIGE